MTTETKTIYLAVEVVQKKEAYVCPEHGAQTYDYCDKCATENLMDNQL